MGAEWLPADVRGKLTKMNADATRFEQQLTKLDEQMMKQIGAQEPQAAKLVAGQGAIQATGEQNAASKTQLDKGKESLQQTKDANQQKEKAAGEAKAKADKRAAELNSAAAKKTQQKETLAQQLAAWAQTHKAARTKALAETQQRLQAKGYKITQVRER
jgi:chromosome segregation ATPase